MLDRVPVRIRLTAGFAAGLALVLILAGIFVYVEVADHLDGALDDSLATRAADVRTLSGAEGIDRIELNEDSDSDESFTQIIRRDGSEIFSTLPSPASILSPDQVAEATKDDLTLNRVRVEGVDDHVRVLAEPLNKAGGDSVVVVGSSTDEMEDTLDGLRQTFVIGGPVALLLASIIGYLLGSRALLPVEAMRRRAREVSFDRPGERLPLPTANDELKRLATTLNEMLDRIEVALQRERVFVSDASHELRTPLALLKAEIELVQGAGSSEAELRAAIESVAEEVDHLILLSENLLVIARSDQGALSLRLEQVDLAALLDRVRSRFLSLPRMAGRSILIEGPVAGEIRCDQMRLEQALVNLVDNAVKHGAGQIVIGALRDRTEMALYVRDDGKGFHPEFRDQAFERFSQADSGRTESGTGLGLAIVRAIATAHGGRVEIEDVTDGAEVRMFIPLNPGSAKGSNRF